MKKKQKINETEIIEVVFSITILLGTIIGAITGFVYVKGVDMMILKVLMFMLLTLGGGFIIGVGVPLCGYLLFACISKLIKVFKN